MTSTNSQVIAMGGGGFSGEPDDPRMDQYILAQARQPHPRVVFIPTASGDADSYTVRFYAAFSRLDCIPSHLPLFQRTQDLRAMLLSQDVIYVGGGNTKSMLAVWKEYGLPAILKDAWQAGVILAGVSAGAMCWFEQGLTDSLAGEMTALDCLGFLKGSFCPHYDSETERRGVFQRFIAAGRLKPGLALDDGAAAHFRGDHIHRLVATQPDARAYQVGILNGAASEAILETVVLPLGSSQG